MKNQITKETVYRIPADVKRESAVTLQEKHLLQKFTNILREDGKNYWFNAERFLRTAEEYNFTAINEQIQNIAQKKDTLCRRMYN